jgi:hypothetical protein
MMEAYEITTSPRRKRAMRFTNFLFIGKIYYYNTLLGCLP